jgi:hypothetical protein
MQDLSQVPQQSGQVRAELLLILNKLHPSEAIALIESVGKELRRRNSIRINNNLHRKVIDLEGRPDWETLKSK